MSVLLPYDKYHVSLVLEYVVLFYESALRIKIATSVLNMPGDNIPYSDGSLRINLIYSI